MRVNPRHIATTNITNPIADFDIPATPVTPYPAIPTLFSHPRLSNRRPNQTTPHQHRTKWPTTLTTMIPTAYPSTSATYEAKTHSI
jgi:hypothetical protein